MKKSTRMILMGGGEGYGKEYERRERDSRNMPRDGYDPYIESKFRDRKGREHYDNGRYAPIGEYNDRLYNAYPAFYPPMVPPVYTDHKREHEKEYMRPMSKIGFSLEGEMDRIPEVGGGYRSDAEYHHMNEMEAGRTNARRVGFADSDDHHMSRSMAERWAMGMQNADGTTGPHWNMEQSKQVMAQRGIECDPVEFWLALNMMYSDYVSTAKELGVNSIDFYSKMAKAFLDDSDAMPGKLARYYEYVVKH